MANRKPMSEEQKKEFAARMKNARTQSAEQEAAADKKADQTEASAAGAKTYTEEQVQAMIAEAAKKAVEDAMRAAGSSVSRAADDVVTVLFMAEVAPTNVVDLPGYGSLRPNSYLEIPKKEFGGKFMSPLARKLIDKRHLIVLSGLDEDERVRWNCDYKEGEVLTERAFDHILDYDIDSLCTLFSKLCPEHQRFVARRFITAKEKGDNRATRDKARAINIISKENDPVGMLKPVIEAFKNDMD